MSSTPAASIASHAAVELAAPANRNRIVALLVTLAVALLLVLSPQLTNSASAATTSRSAVTASKWAKNMLVVLNAERRAHHLRPLTMNKRLQTSAYRHNLMMAKDNTMSHQLRGEAFFANRISKAGYNWRAAGENIGWNSSQSNAGLQTLEKAMYQEKAPNDGHRLNILSKSFRQVGISVYFDRAHHKMWFTQDFGQPA